MGKISEELLLALAVKNSGGGGGGTDDYNDLSNQPQINGNTLVGNKSASDLGLVAAETGKGLSANNYTDEDKAIVGGVTAALAGKQNALTAGKYIDIDENNKIKVNPVVPNETFKYVLQQIENYTIKVTKSVNNVVVSEEIYGPPADWDTPVAVTLDEAIYLYIHMTGTIYYDLLIASDTHDAGYHQQMVWYGRDTYTENFSTVDHSGEKLIIKSELDAALATKADLTDLAPAFSTATAYTVGQYVSYDGNIYKCTSAHSAGAWAAGDFTLVAVGSELESKQNATDNSLQTTDKTVVGAVNELKSGLTNYEAITNAALSVPEDSGKNLFSGSFTTTTNGGVTFTANSDGTVSATNTSTGYASVNSTKFTLKKGQYIFSGVPSGNAKYVLALYANNVVLSQIANGSNVTINLDSDTALVMRCVINGADVETGVDFEPMIRPSFITDPTFAPYIPSVESRIEAVESGLTNVETRVYGDYHTISAGSSVDIPITEGLYRFITCRDSNRFLTCGLITYNWGGTPDVALLYSSDDSLITVTASAGKVTFANAASVSYCNLLLYKVF